ncbi:MAG: hypothetical protein RR448_01420 [Niameybacter sp.]|uniref:hypothetical protein n=1 Tax=Niameybacter sp. TaxID=2033640 RepID=UPI002FCC1492
MKDEKLDRLLGKIFEQTEQVDMKVVYQAKNKARNKAENKEHKKSWYPFIVVIMMNVLLVVMEVVGLMLFADTLKQITIIISLGLGLMQVPVIAYLLGELYYKEKEN